MPRWTYTIRLKDVFHNDAMTFEQRRDAIVARLRNSQWYAEIDSVLRDHVDELAETTDTDGFDYVWNKIYDEADADRAWIETF